MKPELVTIQKIRLVQLGAIALLGFVLSFTAGYFYGGFSETQNKMDEQPDMLVKSSPNVGKHVIKRVIPPKQAVETPTREPGNTAADPESPPPPKSAFVPQKQPNSAKQTTPVWRTSPEKSADATPKPKLVAKSTKDDNPTSPSAEAARAGAARAATTKAASAREKAPSGPKYTLQVASFMKEEDAKRLMDSLIQNNYPAYSRKAVIKGKTWHRVRVGVYSSREIAKEVAEKIEKQKKLKSMVIRHE